MADTAPTSAYKPDGYPSASVYLMCDDAARLIGFLHDVFGAEVLRRTERPDGRIAHVEVRIDDSVVMLADTTEGYPAVTAWLHVYVPDVDATYRRALDAGGTSVQEPAQKDDPDRRAGVADPCGNTWWLATQVG